MRINNLTTLVYITRQKEDSQLKEVLFIVKRSAGLNNGKYLGIGGHFESGESPFDCAVREIGEESGLLSHELSNLSYRGMVSFINDMCDDEYMHVFTAEYNGNREITPGNCDEGELMWIPITEIYDLPIWEGDKEIFKSLFESTEFFNMKLVYHGDELTDVKRY